MIVNFALLTLLFICMIYNLRDQRVPILLTVGGLVGAGVYALCRGLWAPILLTIALILMADFNPRTKRLVFGLGPYWCGFNYPTCSSPDLCPHFFCLDVMGIWGYRWCRRKTADRYDACF